MMSIGMAIVLHGKTIIEWWKPTALCAIIAVFLSAALYRLIKFISGLKSIVFNSLCAFTVAFSFIIGMFYTLNYYCSDTSSMHCINTTVMRKYSQERYRTRRVSRNRITRGEKYHVYYVEIELPDGRTKTLDVAVSEYMRLHVGQTLTLEAEKGLFGITIFKNLKFPIHKSTPSKHLYIS